MFKKADTCEPSPSNKHLITFLYPSEMFRVHTKFNDGPMLRNVHWSGRFWLKFKALVVYIRFFHKLTFISYCDVIWNIMHFYVLKRYILVIRKMRANSKGIENLHVPWSIYYHKNLAVYLHCAINNNNNKITYAKLKSNKFRW